jgi:DNA (cytosine-5)-methyltransferase 1
MSKKYSDIRERLQIVVDKKTTNKMAHLTHYFQNHKNGVSQYYKPTAESYLAELHEDLNIVEESEFQYYLPIKWDIPFPPPEKPTFKFVDLFAGIGGNKISISE